MGSTVRSLTIALRVDAGGMDPGIQAGLARQKEFAAETKRLNEQIAKAKTDYSQAKAGGADEKELAARKASLDAARKERSDAVADFKLKTQLDETYYRSTHSQLEVQLRDRRQYYARLREAHADSAQMLLKIDRTAAAEERRIVAQSAGGGEGEGAGWRGMFARRGPLMHSVREGGRMAGMSGVGGEAGYMGMMLMDMGLLGGGIAAGVMAIAETYKAAAEAAKGLAEVQKEHRDLVKDSVRWLESETRAITTGAGDVFVRRNTELEKQLENAHARWDKQFEEMGGFFRSMAGSWQALWRGGIDQADDFKALHQISEDQELIDRQAETNAERMVREGQIAEVRQKAALAAQIEAATLAAMVDGPEKERLELLHRQEETRRKMREQHDDRMTLFGADPTKTDWDRREERERLAAEEANQEEVFRIERGAQERRWEAQRRSEEVQANEARLRLLRDGYDKEMALLHYKHAEEREAYRQAGRDKTQLLIRQAAEEQEIIEKQRRWVESQLDALSPQRQEAKFRRELADARKAGVLSDADEKTLLARHDRPLDDEIKRDRIERDLARGRISELQAAKARLRLANPLASDEKIDELARLQRDLDQAKKDASASRRDDLRAQREDRFRPMQAGEFSTRYQWGQVDLRAVNFDSPLNTMAAETRNNAEKLGGILRVLERIEVRGSLN